MEPTALSTRDPERLGDWRLLSKLAEGGMGSVYLGESAGRLAAVKTVHPQIAHSANGSQRFHREYAAARLVSSPFVASVVDSDLSGPTPFLAIEYVEGPTLDESIRATGPLTGVGLLRFARNLATGLRSIHEAGVTHRDLKPSNVIMTDTGPVIIDFGIAIIDEERDLTATNQIVGSPGWMSPEHLGVGEIGPPSDIFGWAGLVYFAATGQTPFGTGNHQALMYRIAHGNPEPHNIENPVGDLVTRAFHRQPGQRPTVDALLDQLDTPVATRRSAGHKPAWFRGAAMASAAAVLLAAAVVIAWVALTGDRGGEIETIPSAEQVVVAAETSVTDTAEPIGAAGVMQVDCDGGPVSRLSEVDTAALVPGDRLELKRGCTFTDTLLIAASGTADQPIVLSSFGDPADAAPVITSDVTGALIDLVGSNIDVRDLTLIAAPSDFLPGCEATPSGWTVGIQMGPRSSGNRVENVSISGAHAGVFIDKNASDHVIVANRFDSNTMMNDISGAFGVQIFGDRNLVSGNRFSNHATCHPNYGLEAGAAINIFDGSGNVISDNVSHDDRSFLYINGRADQNPVNNVIERNIIDSDHPESVFVSTDAESVVGGQNRIFHNTAVLRGASAVGLWCGRCSADEIVFANNIVWAATGTSRNASSATYSGGANLFWSDDASPRLASMELTGAPEIVEDPRFVDVNADAFELRACSPALSAARAVDESAAVETLGDGADIGALESGELRCQ